MLAIIGLFTVSKWLRTKVRQRIALNRNRRRTETEAGFFQARPYDAESEDGGLADAAEGDEAEPE